MKWLNLILRVALGGVFMLSAVIKIWDVEVKRAHDGDRLVWVVKASRVPDHVTFAKNVANYRVPPQRFTNLVAIVLPWIEMVVGALLVLGIWKRASALLITVLMLVFLIAIGQAVVRGLNIDCGCFGTVAGRSVGVKAIAEDIAMFVAAVWLVWHEKD